MQNSPFKTIAILVSILGIIGIATAIIINLSKPEEVKLEPIVVATTTPTYKKIGTSVEGRPIDSYTYGTEGKHIVFVGGIHGGYEWNSVALAYEFMDYLKENPETIPKGLKVTVIPNLNPDAVRTVTGKDGPFAVSDVSTDEDLLASARFNANDVDLNRNFDCNWQPKSTWRAREVSGGKAPFSEPEAMSFKVFTAENKPDAFIFWHSQANAVYASQCNDGILPVTLEMMDAYAKASGYPAVKSFDSYAVTGAAEDWLAKEGIPAITVELKTHETLDWNKNIAGIKSLLGYFSPQQIESGAAK